MVHVGLSLDVITYTSFINCLFRKDNGLEALALLEEIKKNGCQSDGCTYNTIMFGLCKSQHLPQALKVFE